MKIIFGHTLRNGKLTYITQDEAFIPETQK